ncbi:MAG: hypothetical protein KKD63_05885 [Proteobacteria bacterium]|nr:hypothetical protein [Desulfobulbaceae bacterium]MBU4152390.1 hypothetical protein [Pseudomonadota bacterium]MDP2105570.1 hypothetical protein [Desulfobulbaceae bacterium]
MPQLENVTAILNTLRSDLKREKEAIITILKDPKIADWNTIDYKHYSPLLDSAGIDTNAISASLNNYQQQAKKIGKQIDAWNIEIGNQLADCIDISNPQTALASAQKLAEKITGLTAMKEEFQTIIRPLITANLCLQQQLDLTPLIAIAKLLAPAKKDQLSSGATILRLLTKQPDDNEGRHNLLDLGHEPERLEARFQRLTINKLPRLIEEILFHHIESSLAANREIKIFLHDLVERMSREISLIATIEKDLRAIQTESPAALIKGLVAQGQIMATLLSSLYHKQNLHSAMDTARVALDSINFFCSIMKNRIIPSLQKEVESAGSPLNPIVVSSKMTRSFFEGTGGIIRSLKLMMNSLKGQEAVNEIELQLMLEKGITNCKTFFGTSHDDLNKIKHYIDGIVSHYKKPFPYNDLFNLVKSTIISYGEGVEIFITDYEIPKDMQLMISPPPTRVGAVTTAINKYKITFQKANANT